MLYLLEETSLLRCNTSTLIESDLDVWSENNILYKNIKQYKRIINKLICLTVTESEISFHVGLLSQFMHKSKDTHWKATQKVLYILKVLLKISYFILNMDMFIFLFFIYWISGDRKSTTKYLIFVGDNLVMWSKKQDAVSRFSADAEYRTIAYTM